jgi:hypothetical protein
LRVANEQDGQKWAEDLVRRVGAAIKAAREGKSAAWLSERTAELGYRVSPTVIAKLDSGHRGSVLSVPELLILAAALGVPPVALLYPDLPDGLVAMVPYAAASSEFAMEWFAGKIPPIPAYPFEKLWQQIADGGGRGEPRHPGELLVEAVWQRIEAVNDLHRLRNDLLRQDDDDPSAVHVKRLVEQQIDLVEQRIARLNASIQGFGGTVTQEVETDG